MEYRFEIFTTQIAKISRNIRRIKTEEMCKHNLKSPHVSCLYYLYKNNGTLTAKQICEICDEDKAAISRSIDYLETNGYISCDKNSEKRYKNQLYLTEQGEAVAESIANKVDSLLDVASEGLSEADRKNFYKSLMLISDNLQKICDSFKED